MVAHRCAVVLLLGSLVLEASPGLTRYSHPGHIYDASDSKPLSNAIARAYQTQADAGDRPCDDEKKPIDRKQTGSDGNFSFEIDTALKQYYAVYCANNYQGVARYNDNQKSGDSALPDPVPMWPNTKKSRSYAPAARTALTYVLDYASNGLRQLQSKDRAGFETARKQANERNRSAMDLLLARQVSSQVRPLIERSAGDPRRVISSLTTQVNYFWDAAPDAFSVAAQDIPPNDRTIVDLLRTERPVGRP